MKTRIIIAILAGIIAAAITFTWLGSPEKQYQLVSQEYNFSAAFPDTPTVTQTTNDEGKAKTEWAVKHDHITWTEYYTLSATCYDETLDPAKEFDNADTDPTWVLNGIKVLQSNRLTISALKTGRELQAFSRVSQDTTTGNILLHRTILDGRCMIDATARVDKGKTEGQAASFILSVKIVQ